MNRLAGSAYARGSDLSKAVAAKSGEGKGEGRGGGCDQTSTTEPTLRYPERDAPFRGDVLARSSPKAQETQPRRRALDRRSQTGMLCPNNAADSLKRELRGRHLVRGTRRPGACRCTGGRRARGWTLSTPRRYGRIPVRYQPGAHCGRTSAQVLPVSVSFRGPERAAVRAAVGPEAGP